MADSDMKKVLLVTNIYPNNDPSYGGTKVCHTFTTEWQKMGYDVRVVHIESLFPRPYYWAGRFLYKVIQARTGFVAYVHTPRKNIRYEVDGIPVLFLPIPKYRPHTSPSPANMQKACSWVCEQLDQEGFVPDIITAHFVLPQLEMIHLLKQHYPSATTCLVLHGGSHIIQDRYPERYKSLMASVDVWGFRSQAFMDDFNNRFGKHPKEFLCHSGIPEKYLSSERRKVSDQVSRFVFVGSLYELKNVDITIRALHQALGDAPYTFDIVGEGAENDRLHQLVDALGVNDKVIFHGRKSRDEAQKLIEQADCFIMVSSREAFGLVYVEAMAKGLMVVGTKGQGIDGVVKDGVNGFLCEAKNVDTLTTVIKKMVSMPKAERQRMSDLSIETARALTDRKVAEAYLNGIIG